VRVAEFLEISGVLHAEQEECSTVSDDLFMCEYSPAKTLEDVFQDMIAQPPHIAARIKQALIELLQDDSLTYEGMSRGLSKKVFLEKVYKGLNVTNPGTVLEFVNCKKNYKTNFTKYSRKYSSLKFSNDGT
jgi:hypothetical protein